MMPEAKQVDLSAILDRRRKLAEQKDGILARVQQIFDQDVSDRNQWPQRAQLQNLRTVAALTDSIREVELFIRYQMGRSGSPIPPPFGEALLQAIRDLNDPNDRELSMEKVRYFLGNLVRYAIVRRPESGQGGGEPAEVEG